ncbi:MAG: hypothetical protein QM736_24870, partial [Vicinamibacterales bacterium]
MLAYDEGDAVRAQQYLDRLLARPEPAPDVAVLRARLAIDEGNLPFARRLQRRRWIHRVSLLT